MSATKYKEWEIVHAMPDGYRAMAEGSPLHGHAFIINGSPLRGGKAKLLKLPEAVEDSGVATAVVDPQFVEETDETPVVSDVSPTCYPSKTVNELARKRFIEQLLKEVMFDLMVCEIEGWSKIEYIKELQDLLNGIHASCGRVPNAQSNPSICA